MSSNDLNCYLLSQGTSLYNIQTLVQGPRWNWVDPENKPIWTTSVLLNGVWVREFCPQIPMENGTSIIHCCDCHLMWLTTGPQTQGLTVHPSFSILCCSWIWVHNDWVVLDFMRVQSRQHKTLKNLIAPGGSIYTSTTY